MRIKNGLKIRSIAGQRVTIDIGSPTVQLTRIVSHNATSEWLWEQLQGRDFDSGVVAQMLVDQYGVERSRAIEDAQHWVDMLSKASMVEE